MLLKFIPLSFFIAFFAENLGKRGVSWKNVLQWIPKIIVSTTFVWSFFISVSFCFSTLVFRLFLQRKSSEVNSIIILGVAFETCIFQCVFVISGNMTLLVLNFFISEYLDQIHPGKEMKEAFQWCPKLKMMFLFKIKIKQKSGCPNKEYITIFKHIYQNIRAYPRRKINLNCSVTGKILLNTGKNSSKKSHWQTS